LVFGPDPLAVLRLLCPLREAALLAILVPLPIREVVVDRLPIVHAQ
jgi:hypothetical protein